MRLGRSHLLGLGEVTPLRLRPWGRRRIGALLVLALLAAPGVIVATRALPVDGVGWALYALHDALFVPLWSRFWVSAGIWSLLWWLPILLLICAATVEYLGLAQPFRRLQIAALRLFLRGPLARATLTGQQLLGWRHNREWLMVAVLETDLAQAEAQIRQALEAGLKETPTRRLARLSLQLAYLRAGEPLYQLRGAEHLALIEACEGEEPAARLRARMAQVWSPEIAQRMADLGQAPPEALPGLLAGLRSARLTAPDLALVTLAMVRPQVLTRPDLVRAWFTEWAQLRHHAARADLAEAERMIDFEFWAARAETALIAMEQASDPGRGGWLSGLLPGVARRRAMGERAALGQGEG